MFRWFQGQFRTATVLIILAVAGVAACDDTMRVESESLAEGEEVGIAMKEASSADQGQPRSRAGSDPVLLKSTLGSTDYTLTSIPFGPEAGPFALAGPGGDDHVTGPHAIGFAFEFFGDSYTDFFISSNGFISFQDNGYWSGCCSGFQIPSDEGLNNLVAVAWTDLYPPGGGAISYETRGTAPNRRLIVNYGQLPWWPSNSPSVDAQVILYEGNGAVEIHTTMQAAGHGYTRGIENDDGSEAVFVPGQVAANFGLTNDAIRFLPAGKVVVDIKPGGNPNSINTNSKGKVPVALLTTSTADGDAYDMDASTIDPSSATFGPGHALSSSSSMEDVDGDGDMDLMLHFPTQDTGIQAGDTSACVTAMTYGGNPIHGCDAVRTVPEVKLGKVESVTFHVNHADCVGTGTLDFQVNGTSVGTAAATEGCYCNAAELTATFAGADIGSAWNVNGTNELTVVAHAAPTDEFAIGYIRADVVGKKSSATLAIFDATGGDASNRDLCDGFEWALTQNTFTNTIY